MAVNKDKVFSTMNDLIVTLKDGEKGFICAAEAIKRSELKELFTEYSHQRTDYINELQTMLSRMGGSSVNTGVSTDENHKGWVDLKSAIASDSDEALLDECEKGEDEAVKEYAAALKGELPLSVKNLLSEQYGNIKAVRDNIIKLQNRYKNERFLRSN